MDHTVNPSAHDDAEQHDQAYQATQYFNIPPGAGTVYPQPSAPFSQDESFWQDLLAQSTTEMPISTIPSYFHSQGEGSDTTPYAPDFSNQTLQLSYPNPEHGRRISSHEFRLRPTPGASSNVHRSQPSAHHSRVLSQPYPRRPSMATPSGGRGSVFAGPYAGPSHLTPMVSNFEPEIIQPRPSLAPQSANFVTHSIPHSQAPGPAASSFPRRWSEADVSHRKNVFRPQAFVNQPTPTVYRPVHEYLAPPLATSSTQYPASGPMDTIQETLSHTSDDPADYVDPNYSIPPSPSYESLDDSNSVTSFPESASPGPSGGAGHVGQQDNLPTASGSHQKRRHTGKRKRVADPKDPTAAERLRKQREDDDENIEALFNLIVPSTVGKGPKKDRLSIIRYYAKIRMSGDNNSAQDKLTLRHEPGGGHSIEDRECLRVDHSVEEVPTSPMAGFNVQSELPNPGAT